MQGPRVTRCVRTGCALLFSGLWRRQLGLRWDGALLLHLALRLALHGPPRIRPTTLLPPYPPPSKHPSSRVLAASASSTPRSFPERVRAHLRPCRRRAEHMLGGEQTGKRVVIDSGVTSLSASPPPLPPRRRRALPTVLKSTRREREPGESTPTTATCLHGMDFSNLAPQASLASFLSPPRSSLSSSAIPPSFPSLPRAPRCW